MNQEAVIQNVIPIVLGEYTDAQPLDDETQQRIRAAITSTVQELFQTLDGIRDANMNDEQAVAHLPQNRRAMMKTALELTTFQLQFDEKNPQTVEFKRKDLYSPIKLSTSTYSARANLLVNASVAVESINVVLKTIGINFPSDARYIKTVTDHVNAIQLDKGKNSLMADVKNIKNNRHNQDEMVDYMFSLVINAYKRGILWDIVKHFFVHVPDGMKWKDWLVISGKITAFIEVLVARDGRTDIAALVRRLNVENVEFIVQKLDNLEMIERQHQEQTRREMGNLH